MPRFGSLSDEQVNEFALELLNEMLNHIETSLSNDAKLWIIRDTLSSLQPSGKSNDDNDDTLLTDSLLAKLPRVKWSDSAECRQQTMTPGFSIKPAICSIMYRVKQQVNNESKLASSSSSCSSSSSLSFLESLELSDAQIKDRDGCVCVQIRVLRQIIGGLCGYHALFNAVQLVAMMVAEQLDESIDGDDDMWMAVRASIGADLPVFAPEFAANTASKRIKQDLVDRLLDATLNWPTFWRFHEHSKQLLREHAVMYGDGDFYPWSLDFVNQAVLERPYCEYLLRGADCTGRFPTQLLGGEYKFECYPELNVNCLKCGMVEVAQLVQIHQRLEDFREACGQRRQLAMVFGAGNHWITIVGEKSKSGRTSLVHCDSLNNPALALGNDPATLERLVEHYAEAHWGGFESEAKRSKYLRDYRRHLREVRFLVELIADCVIGARNLLEEGVNYRAIGLLENFALARVRYDDTAKQQQLDEDDDRDTEQHQQSDVLLQSSESFSDISVRHVLHFCNEFSPPSMLRRETLPFLCELRSFLRPRTIDRMRTWMSTVRTVIGLDTSESLTEQESFTITTLLSLFDDLESLFDETN